MTSTADLWSVLLSAPDALRLSAFLVVYVTAPGDPSSRAAQSHTRQGPILCLVPYKPHICVHAQVHEAMRKAKSNDWQVPAVRTRLGPSSEYGLPSASFRLSCRGLRVCLPCHKPTEPRTLGRCWIRLLRRNECGPP